MAEVTQLVNALGVTTTVVDDPTTSPVGKAYNYTIVIQVPLPYLNLNINTDLAGAFIMPIFSRLGIPKAVASYMTKARKLYTDIIEDAQSLIKAIPEASVTIIVKVGIVTVVNVVLIAKKVPVVITPPTFALALPNFAVDLNLQLAIPFPVLKPIVIEVPIPYPVASEAPLVTISGGQLSTNVSGGVTRGSPGVSGSASGSTSGVGIGASSGITSPFGSAGTVAAASSGSAIGGAGLVLSPETASAATTTAASSPTAGVGGVATVAYPSPPDFSNPISMPPI